MSNGIPNPTIVPASQLRPNPAQGWVLRGSSELIIPNSGTQVQADAQDYSTEVLFGFFQLQTQDVTDLVAHMIQTFASNGVTLYYYEVWEQPSSGVLSNETIRIISVHSPT